MTREEKIKAIVYILEEEECEDLYWVYEKQPKDAKDKARDAEVLKRIAEKILDKLGRNWITICTARPAWIYNPGGDKKEQ